MESNNHSRRIADRAVTIATWIAAAFLALLLGMERAHAQSGNVYAPNQAQVAGEVWEGKVLQVSLREVGASLQARAAGGAIAGALGLALASQGSSENRYAVTTVATLIGGLLGERVTSAFAGAQAQEIILLVQPAGQQPRTMVVVQPAPFEAVSQGESVYVTMVNGAYRVIRRGMID